MGVGITGPRLASSRSENRTQVSQHLLCSFHYFLPIGDAKRGAQEKQNKV